MARVFGAEFRRVDHRVHLGEPAVAAIAIRTYDTTVEDLWQAVTTPERLVRWFATVKGDLKLGGRYHIEGNASGTITRCDPPQALDLTWEIMGGTSWVNVRLVGVESSVPQARLTIEHIAAKDGIGEEHLRRFGPGAVGVGWDLWLHGLELHLSDRTAALDPSAAEAWLVSSQGKAFVRASGDAWAAADAAGGESPEQARAKSERTIAFYTGG